MSFWIRIHSAAALILVLVVCVAACTSRYRLDLYLTTVDQRSKVKVETTEFAPKTVLTDPMTEQKVIPGVRNTVVVSIGMRGQPTAESAGQIFAFDEYLRLRFYVELPEPLAADTLSLHSRSFVQMLGRYELSPDQKLFRAQDGRIVIDSVTQKHLYATVDGRFANSEGTDLRFDGRFKVKIAD